MTDFPSSPQAVRAVRVVNVVLVIAIGVLFVRALTGCESPVEAYKRGEREACRDEAALLATPADSVDTFTCPNKRHRMRVTVTVKRGEELATLVACECQP
jgi:hypothetical protein